MSDEGATSAAAEIRGRERPEFAASLTRLVSFAPALIAVVAFFLLWPTASSLISEWRDDSNTTTYTHGFLVAAVCLWLLYRNGRELAHIRTAPSFTAWVLLIASVLVWLVAVRAGIQTIHQVLLPVLSWLAIWAALGLRAAWVSSFGLGYLYFAIPIWGHVNEALQYGTVLVVEWLLRLTGVTAYVEDTFVHIGSGVIEIAHGCSGLHYFIVGSAIATLYGEVHRDPLKLRLLQVAIGALLATATNWIRVYIIIVAGHLTHMQHYLVTESHYMFGWYVFAVAMIVYFLIVRKIEPAESAAKPVVQAVPTLNGSSLALGLALACSALALGPMLGGWAGSARAVVPNQTKLLPSDPDPWSGPLTPTHSDWSPVFVGADVVAQGAYKRFDDTIDLYVAAYEYQTQKKELVGYRNSLVGDSAMRVLSRTSIAPRGAATELVVETRAGQKYVLWYFYQVGSLQTNKDVVAQVWYGLSSLLDSPLSSVVAIRGTCRDTCESARSALQSFLDSADLTVLTEQPS